MVENYKRAWDCKKCGHIWVNRKKTKPLLCPKCHTYLWEREPVPQAKGATNES